MKRTLVLVLGLAMLATLAGSASAKTSRVAREETQAYSLPTVVGAETDYPGLAFQHLTFDPAGARTVTITVEDQASPNVLVELVQAGNRITTFCTQSEGPVAIDRYTPLEVSLYFGSCDGLPSFITTGAVRARFGGVRG